MLYFNSDGWYRKEVEMFYLHLLFIMLWHSDPPASAFLYDDSHILNRDLGYFCIFYYILSISILRELISSFANQYTNYFGIGNYPIADSFYQEVRLNRWPGWMDMDRILLWHDCNVVACSVCVSDLILYSSFIGFVFDIVFLRFQIYLNRFCLYCV